MSHQASLGSSFQAGMSFAQEILPQPNVRSQWVQVVYHAEYDSQDFYSRIKAYLDDKGIPMSIGLVKKSGGTGPFSKRTYLQVRKGRLTYFICAAPYGNTFFFSYWLQESSHELATLFRILPFIGRPIANFINSMTFFEADSYAIFRRVVMDAVETAFNDLVEVKGQRAATQPKNQAELKTFSNQ